MCMSWTIILVGKNTQFSWTILTKTINFRAKKTRLLCHVKNNTYFCSCERSDQNIVVCIGAAGSVPANGADLVGSHSQRGGGLRQRERVHRVHQAHSPPGSLLVAHHQAWALPVLPIFKLTISSSGSCRDYKLPKNFTLYLCHIKHCYDCRALWQAFVPRPASRVMRPFNKHYLITF